MAMVDSKGAVADVKLHRYRSSLVITASIEPRKAVLAT
jgi:hypothetical protein